MRLERPLDDIFASGTHIKVLRALSGLAPEMSVSGRDIARRAGVSHPRAIRVLASLNGQGLVTVQRLPRRDLYRLNRRHVLAPELLRLIAREPHLKFELLAMVAKELRNRALPVTEARIFGSATRGAMTSTSDIDLALVTSRKGVPVVEAAMQQISEKVYARFGTRLNVLVGAPSLQSLARSGQGSRSVWQTIRREGIDVLSGVPDDAGG